MTNETAALTPSAQGTAKYLPTFSKVYDWIGPKVEYPLIIGGVAAAVGLWVYASAVNTVQENKAYKALGALEYHADKNNDGVQPAELKSLFPFADDFEKVSVEIDYDKVKFRFTKGKDSAYAERTVEEINNYLKTASRY